MLGKIAAGCALAGKGAWAPARAPFAGCYLETLRSHTKARCVAGRAVIDSLKFAKGRIMDVLRVTGHKPFFKTDRAAPQ
jgi:hypothetical protein